MHGGNPNWSFKHLTAAKIVALQPASRTRDLICFTPSRPMCKTIAVFGRANERRSECSSPASALLAGYITCLPLRSPSEYYTKGLPQLSVLRSVNTPTTLRASCCCCCCFVDSVCARFPRSGCSELQQPPSLWAQPATRSIAPDAVRGQIFALWRGKDDRCSVFQLANVGREGVERSCCKDGKVLGIRYECSWML